jgi:alpha-galactosidase
MLSFIFHEMKRLRFFLLLIAPLVNIGAIQAQATIVPSERAIDSENWVISHFKKGAIPPFSFNYGNIPSSEFIASWNYACETLPPSQKGEICHRFTYSDPAGGLKVVCDVKAYDSYNAVDWVIRFVNGGKANSARISDVRSADLTFATRSHDYRLHYDHGSTPSKDDFKEELKVFTKRGESMTMKPLNGRSSDGPFLPFYNIETGDRFGVIVGVGWTGTWISEFKMDGDRNLSMKTGLAYFDSYLYPKEEFRGASVCLLFWNGYDRYVGHNKFRRFMREMHGRKIDGKPAVYPQCMGYDWGSYPKGYNEYEGLTAEYAHKVLSMNKKYGLIPECFWLDAGWHVGAHDPEHGKYCLNTNGTWIADPERFPNDLRELADEAHSLGAKFMVWFEPERVSPGSLYTRLHPEWLLKESDSNENRLVNLANPEAVEWLSREIGDYMEKNGIDYYRQDFNMNIDGFWRENDSPDRKGMTEVHYIEGFYKFWDNLLERFPKMIIDNCASGGRRLDYETMWRSAPMWRTDYNYGETDGQQCHTYGLDLYLSQHGTGTFGVVGTDEYTFRSVLQNSVTFDWILMDTKLDPVVLGRLSDEFFKVRPYTLEDYYPLSEEYDPTSEDSWLAYQLERPNDCSGYVVAFCRPQCKELSFVARLHAVKAHRMYIVTNCDTGEVLEKSGEELGRGIELSVPAPRTSVLLKYELK